MNKYLWCFSSIYLLSLSLCAGVIWWMGLPSSSGFSVLSLLFAALLSVQCFVHDRGRALSGLELRCLSYRAWLVSLFISTLHCFGLISYQLYQTHAVVRWFDFRGQLSEQLMAFSLPLEAIVLVALMVALSFLLLTYLAFMLANYPAKRRMLRAM